MGRSYPSLPEALPLSLSLHSINVYTMAGYVLNSTAPNSSITDQMQDLSNLYPGVHSQQYDVDESNVSSNNALIVQSHSSDPYMNLYQQPASSIKASLGPEFGLADYATALDQPNYELMRFYPNMIDHEYPQERYGPYARARSPLADRDPPTSIHILTSSSPIRRTNADSLRSVRFGNLPPTSYPANPTRGMMGSNQTIEATLSAKLGGTESVPTDQTVLLEAGSEVARLRSRSNNSAPSHSLPDGYVDIGNILSNGKNREDKYKCNHTDCTNVIFDRLADLKRHHASRHRGSGRLNAQFWCPVPNCPRSKSGNKPFPRKDKMYDHIDKVHG